MTDENIDYSDIPPLTDEQLAKMKPLRDVLPQAVPNKVRITIRLDADIVKWFKDEIQQAGGGSYQSLLNLALRQHIESKKEPLEATLRRVIREELQTIEG
ncbi:MAG: BrnA antitoxin family protein [Gammaproteobacteria bacterium]|nr:BrnA antitoxin family protein [Gammaproteobacteria bacterium]